MMMLVLVENSSGCGKGARPGLPQTLLPLRSLPTFCYLLLSSKAVLLPSVLPSHSVGLTVRITP